MRALVLVVLAGCWGTDSNRVAGAGWKDGHYCQFSLCEGHCCEDSACWTQFCSRIACKAPLALTPVAAGDANAASVIAGGNRTCVLTQDGHVRCWGDLDKCVQPTGYATDHVVDQFSNALTFPQPRTYPSDVPLGVTATAVSIGSWDVCAIGTDRGLRCWGQAHGVEKILDNVTQVAVGFSHTCAVMKGHAMCWGYNERGELGLGDREIRKHPQAVAVGKPVIAVALGARHTCAITEDHALRCWGEALDGALGYGTSERMIGDDEQPATAGDVPLGEPVLAVVAGVNHTCVLVERGRVRCWGDAKQGQLGNGFINKISDAREAKDVPLGGKAIALAAGAYHTCALLEAGKVRCWGLDADGQLGYGAHDGHAYNNIGDTEPASAAGDVPLGEPAVEITAGNNHSCARLASGALRCWGKAEQYQLGYVPDPKKGAWSDSIGDDETPASRGNVPFAPNWEAK